MRILGGILTIASFLLYQLGGFDFYQLADKYGVPVAFLVFVTILFLAQVKAERRERNTYRTDMMLAQEKVVTILEKVLAEARIGNNSICKFKDYRPEGWKTEE